MTMLAMKRGKPGETENTFLQLSNKMGEKIFKQLKLFIEQPSKKVICQKSYQETIEFYKVLIKDKKARYQSLWHFKP